MDKLRQFSKYKSVRPVDCKILKSYTATPSFMPYFIRGHSIITDDSFE